ncbi:uncharacterized protein VTP21DRAFT_4994 [Calcarisporiella thermophila]|uniref:uncharacterized protein n=1 Tax=Calcarisporiella thermophila TaxID=911321 RepID=UPI003743DE9E
MTKDSHHADQSPQRQHREALSPTSTVLSGTNDGGPRDPVLEHVPSKNEALESDIKIQISEMPTNPSAEADLVSKEKRLGGSRLFSIDLMRGLTIVLMIMANSQIDPLPNLGHAEWFGFTIADSIFPSFLFIAGVSIPLAFHRADRYTPGRLAFKIAKRTFLLFSIGLLLNGFPYHYPNLVHNWRIAGVLQRIALCYLVNAVAFVLFGRGNLGPDRKLWKHVVLTYVFPAVAFILWMALMYGVYVPFEGCHGRGILTPECSTESLFDTAIYGQNRNYQKKAFDPEGSLSHMTAALNTWAGVQVGIRFVKTREQLKSVAYRYQTIVELMLIALPLILLAIFFNPVVPIGKPLWTPTFVLMSVGVALLSLAVIMYASDIKLMLQSQYFAVRLFFRSVLNVGRNPLVIYVLSEAFTATLFSIPTNDPQYSNVWSWLFHRAFASWLPGPLASLIWSILGIVCLYIPLAWLLDWRKIYIRI